MVVIEANDYQKVTRRALHQACLTALQEQQPGTTAPNPESMAIATALEHTRIKHPEQDYVQAADQCLHGMASSLNRHSAYIDATEFKLFQQQAFETSRAGIGIEIAAEPHGARIIAVIKGAPTERAGVEKDETLTRIDDRDLAGTDTCRPNSTHGGTGQ